MTRPLFATLLGLSIYAQFIPEISEGMNRVLSFCSSGSFPPSNIQKWHVTEGISRDFADLRHSLTCTTRNPRSQFFFLSSEAIALISLIGLIASTKKGKPKLP